MLSCYTRSRCRKSILEDDSYPAVLYACAWAYARDSDGALLRSRCRVVRPVTAVQPNGGARDYAPLCHPFRRTLLPNDIQDFVLIGLSICAALIIDFHLVHDYEK